MYSRQKLLRILSIVIQLSWLVTFLLDNFCSPSKFLLKNSAIIFLTKALNMPVKKIPLNEFIQNKGKASEQSVPREVEGLLKNYLESYDVLFLQKLIETIHPYTFTYIIDPLSQENFLVILNSEQQVIKALSVDPKELQEQKNENIPLNFFYSPRNRYRNKLARFFS
jgi:hypothetical protein